MKTVTFKWNNNGQEVISTGKVVDTFSGKLVVQVEGYWSNFFVSPSQVIQ